MEQTKALAERRRMLSEKPEKSFEDKVWAVFTNYVLAYMELPATVAGEDETLNEFAEELQQRFEADREGLAQMCDKFGARLQAEALNERNKQRASAAILLAKMAFDLRYAERNET